MAKNGKDEQGVSNQQAAVIRELLTGKTQKAAAEAVGVSDATISRWLHDDDSEFAFALSEQRALLWQADRDRLQALSAEALDTLSEIMRTGENDGDRLKAALAVLKAVGMETGEAAKAPHRPDPALTALLKDLC